MYIHLTWCKIWDLWFLIHQRENVSFTDMKGLTEKERERWRERGGSGLWRWKGPWGLGKGELSLKAHSLMACSEEWERKWTDKIGCYGGRPGSEGWGRVRSLSSTVLRGNCENPPGESSHPQLINTYSRKCLSSVTKTTLAVLHFLFLGPVEP